MHRKWLARGLHLVLIEHFNLRGKSVQNEVGPATCSHTILSNGITWETF